MQAFGRDPQAGRRATGELSMLSHAHVSTSSVDELVVSRSSLGIYVESKFAVVAMMEALRTRQHRRLCVLSRWRGFEYRQQQSQPSDPPWKCRDSQYERTASQSGIRTGRTQHDGASSRIEGYG